MMTETEPWTIGRLLNWTVDYLKARGAESARLDAEVLLADARGCQRIDLYTAFDEPASDELRNTYRELVRRRAEGTPVAYLVGRREFYSLSFRVTPDVLIPRPETELVVLTALDRAREMRLDGPATFADVGTGSGAIAVCLARHCADCLVTAIDRSRAALRVAAENVARHEVTGQIELAESDLFAAVASGRRFHVIVSNPPYVSSMEMDSLPPDVRNFEPREALYAGVTGTEVIERLIDEAAGRLLPGGWLIFEISPTIAAKVQQMIEADKRFAAGPLVHDTAGLARVVQAQRRE